MTRISLFALALTAAVLAACSDPPPPPAPTPPPATEQKPAKKAILDADQRKVFQPLAQHFDVDGVSAPEARIQLGRVLFHDARLSKGGDVSCNSCHTLDKYGVDGQPTSTGFKGQKGGRNSPTVFNAAGHFTQFWDGRAKDVEEQAKGPVLNPIEMAMGSDKEVVDLLRSIPGYAPLFQAAFPDDKDPITWDNYAKAVGAFERKLTTPSRYDRWAAGDDTALTDAEQEGALTFMRTGCLSCHSGALFGGAMFQKAGLVKPWFSDKDRGRKDLTKADADDFFFKVPSLRNIEKTAPYFHDGSVASLEEAVRIMGRHQLGKEIPDADVASIVTFLKTLTGELPKDLIAAPELPPSPNEKAKPKKG